MNFFIASVLALALGPILASLGGGRRGAVQLMDGFVVVAVPGLILLFFIPEALEYGAILPIVAMAAGFVLPLLIDHTGRIGHDDGLDRLALVLGVTGLAVHAALDGAALPRLAEVGGAPFGVAIVLHRLPVGLAVWWLLDMRLGRRPALLGLASLMIATAVGFGLGGRLLAASGPGVLLYQAFVGGSLIHVALHPPVRQPGGPRSGLLERRMEGLGSVLALALLVATMLVDPGHHAPGEVGFGTRFWILAAESAPALLIAYPIAGLLDAFLPGASIRWMSRGGAMSAAGKGMVVGLPFPICSCGVVPLYKALIQRGAPPAAAMAFLVSTPELGLDAVFLSIPLLGPELTGLRVLTAAFVALMVGWLVGGRVKQVRATHEAAGEGLPLHTGLSRAVRTGLVEVVDHTAPWIVAGLAVAAMAAPLFEGGWLASIPFGVDVLLFSIIGFPLYVCASSATPLVATLVATGLSPGAAIAFLITGPATNATTLGILTGEHGRKVALTFAVTLVALAISSGLAINVAFGGLAVPSLASLTEEAPGLLHQLSLVLLLLLFGASVLRRGIRRFTGELKEGLGAGGGHHARAGVIAD